MCVWTVMRSVLLSETVWFRPVQRFQIVSFFVLSVSNSRDIDISSIHILAETSCRSFFRRDVTAVNAVSWHADLVKGWTTEESWFYSQHEQDIFRSPQRQDRPWDPPTLLLKGHQDFFQWLNWPKPEANYLLVVPKLRTSGAIPPLIQGSPCGT